MTATNAWRPAIWAPARTRQIALIAGIARRYVRGVLLSLGGGNDCLSAACLDQLQPTATPAAPLCACSVALTAQGGDNPLWMQEEIQGVDNIRNDNIGSKQRRQRRALPLENRDPQPRFFEHEPIIATIADTDR